MHSPLQAQNDTTFRWAGTLEHFSSGVDTPLNALGSPDPEVAHFQGTAPLAIYADFGIEGGVFNQTPVNTTALAAFLGGTVTVKKVQEADFIAFEFNGLTGGPSFESCVWSFDDGCSPPVDVTQVIPNVGFSNLAGNGWVYAQGNLSVADYQTLFGQTGISSSYSVAVLMFNIPSVEMQCPELKVTIASAGGGVYPGSPDIDAMAVLPGDGTPLCNYGPCPCGNTGAIGRGCDNSLPGVGGGMLSGRGVAEFGIPDTFGLLVCGLPQSLGLMVKGSNLIANGDGVLIGDGRLCMSPQVRSQIQFPDLCGRVRMIDWKGQKFGDYPNAANSGVPTYYTYWYRDPFLCTGANFNFSNAWSVTWE